MHSGRVCPTGRSWWAVGCVGALWGDGSTDVRAKSRAMAKVKDVAHTGPQSLAVGQNRYGSGCLHGSRGARMEAVGTRWRGFGADFRGSGPLNNPFDNPFGKLRTWLRTEAQGSLRACVRALLIRAEKTVCDSPERQSAGLPRGHSLSTL